jgi:class 3 adenylate cyclase/Tfp pilus assembly protein PilF
MPVLFRRFRTHCSRASLTIVFAIVCQLLSVLAPRVVLGTTFTVSGAVPRTVDSLKSLLGDVPADTFRVAILTGISSRLSYTDAVAAQRYAEEALALSNRLQFGVGIARSQNALGVAARIQGLYAVAAEYHFDALRKSESLSDTSGIALALHNIGRVYEAQRESEKGLEYLRRALELRLRLPKPLSTDIAIDIAETKHYMGNCFGNKREFDSAYRYYTEAKTLRERLNDRRGTATLINNIGWILRLQRHYDSSLVMFQAAYVVYDSLGDMRGRALTLDNTGIVYFERGEFMASKNALQRALEYAQNAADRREINDLYAALANTHEAMGDFREANTYRRLRDELKDSLFNERSSKLVAELNSRYAAEKQEQQLAMLRAESESNRLWWVAVALGILAALITIVSLLYTNRMNARGNEGLRRKQAELEARNRDIETINTQMLDLNHEVSAAYEQADALNQNLTDTLQALQFEKTNADALLLNILPASIAERLKKGEFMFAQRYPAASVFFADIAGFTPLAASMAPEELVQILSEIFVRFDNVLELYGIEKIKTIGDCYMVASGLPQERDDHLHVAAHAALAMMREIEEFNVMFYTTLKIRIGLHTGPVVAGVIGKKKFAFDLWGDTVNIASRMESHGIPDRVHCTEAVYKALKDEFVFESRGEIEIKGRGFMDTYFLLDAK